MQAARAFMRDQRGTASIEAAMMLPLMGLCWIALFYRLATLDATLLAGVEARRTAWATSNNACRGEATSYECGGSAVSTADGSASGGGWLDALTDAPIVGFLFGSLLGSSTTAHASREVNVPPLLGGGTVQAGYGYYIMCNEEPMGLDDLLMSTICEQLGGTLDFLVSCPAARHDNVPEGCGLPD